MFSDQFYWASRVVACRIGVSTSLANLASALREAIDVDARSFASKLSSDGARVAASKLVALAG
jgi:UDP:flavonoid glycosyltransferase YjiC (YdhE family)